MTGLKGNRQIYLTREIQDCLPKRKFWRGDPESQEQIDSLLPEGPVIFCFIIPLFKRTLKEKKFF